MSVQDGLAVGNFVGKPPNGYVGPPFKLRDSSCGTDDLCPAGLLVRSFRSAIRLLAIGSKYSVARINLQLIYRCYIV
jgi:hypothetical protein